LKVKIKRNQKIFPGEVEVSEEVSSEFLVKSKLSIL